MAAAVTTEAAVAGRWFEQLLSTLGLAAISVRAGISREQFKTLRQWRGMAAGCSRDSFPTSHVRRLSRGRRVGGRRRPSFLVSREVRSSYDRTTKMRWVVSRGAY